ncbi:hypothetical protein [Paenibacillus sp. 1P03SA]|uniref:hypothetical protein n=1 Tax=Paenibacillus sp. 1P03SA TaxID=3132294 RepID=UPI00399F4013
MNHYAIKAAKKERAFFRKLHNREYLTGRGMKNVIVEVTRSEVLFLTKKSKAPQRIKRSMLRKAMTFLFYRRTVTRKELATMFKCKFNSAMLGLLRAIFINMSRIHKATKGGLMRITLKSVRHFFSGAVRSPKDLHLAVANGARFFLVSYAHVRFRKNWYAHFEKLAKLYGIKLLIDSGAYTVDQAIKKGKDVPLLLVEEYASFLDRFQHLIYGAFTLDVIGNADASRENTEYLRAKGFSPIEVFHYGSDWSELKKMVSADQEVIGIGGTVGLSEKKKREYFTELFDRFPGQLFHLLGCGSPLILEFPFFSSDSSTWLLGRKFKILTTPKQVKAPQGWNGDDCIAYNARFQSQYEEWNESASQIELALVY